MSKAIYRITVGETGNEYGHSRIGRHVSDEAAIRAAKRSCSAYRGDGWWIVVPMVAGCVVGGGWRGGRSTL